MTKLRKIRAKPLVCSRWWDKILPLRNKLLLHLTASERFGEPFQKVISLQNPRLSGLQLEILIEHHGGWVGQSTFFSPQYFGQFVQARANARGLKSVFSVQEEQRFGLFRVEVEAVEMLVQRSCQGRVSEGLHLHHLAIFAPISMNKNQQRTAFFAEAVVEVFKGSPAQVLGFCNG